MQRTSRCPLCANSGHHGGGKVMGESNRPDVKLIATLSQSVGRDNGGNADIV